MQQSWEAEWPGGWHPRGTWQAKSQRVTAVVAGSHLQGDPSLAARLWRRPFFGCPAQDASRAAYKARRWWNRGRRSHGLGFSAPGSPFYQQVYDLVGMVEHGGGPLTQAYRRLLYAPRVRRPRNCATGVVFPLPPVGRASLWNPNRQVKVFSLDSQPGAIPCSLPAQPSSYPVHPTLGTSMLSWEPIWIIIDLSKQLKHHFGPQRRQRQATIMEQALGKAQR